MNKQKLYDNFRKAIYGCGILLACYGFWGSFFPDLTLVDGTYRIVASDDVDKEQLMLDLLEGKYKVTYRSKLFEIIKNQFGYQDNE